MIVNQFSSFPYGGAGGAARRHHDQLLAQQIDSRFYFWKDSKKKNRDSTLREMLFLPEWDHPLLRPLVRKYRKMRLRRIRRQYDNHLSKRARNFEVFSTPRLPHNTSFRLEELGGDVVHLHWISFFLDYPSFFASIPDHFPLVWTLHDMNPISGGCHYSGGCSRFKLGCGHCPQISNPDAKDVSYEGYRVKQRALRRKSLTVITPSQWLQDLAKQSRIFPKQTRFEVLRLGFDLDCFHPIDKYQARNALGVSSDATLIAFGAEDINNYRKGFHHLLEALPTAAAKSNIECLVFGTGKLPSSTTGMPKFHSFGFVDSPEKQAQIYSAADIFVLPSREDNSPQTGLEAMACGTPVVAFDAGGIPEYVVHGETGMLAPVGDATVLAELICWMAENDTARESMNRRCRKLMENRYEIQTQTAKHVDLYSELIDRSQSIRQRRRAA